MLLWPFLVTAAIALLIGSIPTGWIVARIYRVDIQQTGSGNIGATNVFRVLGKGPGLFVLLFDAAKGYMPCRLLSEQVQSWFFESGAAVPEVLSVYLPIVAGLGAILGHMYTPWLGFKGGKGVATGAGVLAAWMPIAFVISLLAWLLVFTFSGYVSLGSIAAAASLPFALWATGGSPPYIVVAAAIGALAIWKHRTNFARIRAGKEPKFGRRARRGRANSVEDS